VDDVVVKTRNSDTLIADLEETFASLREYRWKLNLNKCIFGVPSGKLLGFIISHRDIEANPEKISTITKKKVPTCVKDVQTLTGCMAALNKFNLKLGEWGLPFFKPLKYQEKFVWTPEADQALAQQIPATLVFCQHLGIGSWRCSTNLHCAAIPGVVRVLCGIASIIP
jgi:hypothetical protein